MVSIDPGIRGALVLLDRGAISKAYKMPILKEGDRSRIDVPSLLSCLQESRPEVCIIEKPQFRPEASAQSHGTTGINWGMVYGVILSLGIPVVQVDAVTWTKKIHSIDKRCQAIEDTKEKAKLIFDKLYPKGWNGKPVTHDGIIDATLIGFWWLWEQGLLSKYKQI